MENKGELRTLRMAKTEINLIDRYLKLNPAIENFSQLARIAILDFISRSGEISLRPIVSGSESKRPPFLWDYDLTEAQVHEVLKSASKMRLWLTARILEHGRFDEVWKYLTPREIEHDLPKLRLPSKIKKHWEYALKHWRTGQ